MAGRLLREAVRQKIREYVDFDPTGRVKTPKQLIIIRGGFGIGFLRYQFQNPKVLGVSFLSKKSPNPNHKNSNSTGSPFFE